MSPNIRSPTIQQRLKVFNSYTPRPSSLFRLHLFPRAIPISSSRLFIPPLISLPTRRFSASTSVAWIANSVCLIHVTRYAREPGSSLFFHRLALHVLISRHDETAVVRFSVSSFSSLFVRNPPRRTQLCQPFPFSVASLKLLLAANTTACPLYIFESKSSSFHHSPEGWAGFKVQRVSGG